ncbi:MAG: hypothetical protein U9R19_09665 [Bacteroidota bacterium]|nr:hypothetical protein [Bacteroidota bacterium]
MLIDFFHGIFFRIIILLAGSVGSVLPTDIIPQMYNKTKAKDSVLQVSEIISGILIIYFIKLF